MFTSNIALALLSYTTSGPERVAFRATMASKGKINVDPDASKDVKEIAESLELAHSEIQKMKKYLDAKYESEAALEKRIEILERENREIRDYASDIEEYVLQVDSSTRKKNIVISGLSETKKESTESLIMLVFKYLHPYLETLEIGDIDTAYRLGKKSARTRPILCKFTKEKTRNDLYAIRSALNDSETPTKVFLNDDLPQLINERRADFRIITKLAKAQNIPVSYQNNKITVNNISYSHRNIDCLPPGLRPEDAKIVKVKGGFAFHSAHAWMSNFYPCKIDLQGITFLSAEQAFQYARAIRLKDTYLAKLILRTKKASEAKGLGYSNTNSTPEWERDRFDVMRHIVTEKFAQNFELAGKLVSTGQELLIEATMDAFWGAKASITSKAIRDGSWMGANFLGKILGEVRDQLRRDLTYADFLNAPYQATVDYTPPTQHGVNAMDVTATYQPMAPHTHQSQRALVDNQRHSFPQQQHTEYRDSLLPLSQRSNQSLLLNETSMNVTSRKNKIRPESESSHEGGSPFRRPAFKKKQRIYSPTSSLPPTRIIEDLFACPPDIPENFDPGEVSAV